MANPQSAIRNPQLKRRCTRCGRVRPIEEFGRNHKGPLARRHQCRDCRNADRRRRRARRRDHVCRLERLRYARSRERIAAKRRRPEFRARQSARLLVWYAVKTGVLERGKRCARCGARPRRRRLLQAHHRDYARPLWVVWLCSLCHAREHRRMRNAE